MTTDERVLAEIAQANPLPEPASPTPPQRAEAERILRRVLSDAAASAARRPRPALGLLVPVASLLVVVGVAALILRTGGSSTTGSTSHGGLHIALAVEPTPQTPQVTPSAMHREIAVIRRRLATLGGGYSVGQAGPSRIVVTPPGGRAAERSRIEQLISRPAYLYFYDWEANVLTPNGRTAASQLLTQDRAALAVSQGGSQGAGSPGPGSMSLYDAVTLAATQPPAPASRSLSRLGPQYYLFAPSGSSACAAAARYWGAGGTPPGHCLLAGPLSAATRRDAIGTLASAVPPGVNASEGQVRGIPQGTVILQAAQLNAAAPVPIFSPKARFFVLRDRLALSGAELTHPRASTDQGGEPDVAFGFTGRGQAAFRRVTGDIAHRGANVSVGGSEINQHFAVALDNQLLTVPQIDFQQYPDGIIGGGGAEITGGFTHRSARDLATELRYGALPLAVRIVR